jgi:hypothetical protein
MNTDSRLSGRAARVVVAVALIVAAVFVAAGDIRAAPINDNHGAVGPFRRAERLDPQPPYVAPSTTIPYTGGIWGQPFAPGGLSNCEEFRFYADQFGLPAQFDAIAWRESNCRQELGVSTSCCWGYLQLDASLHLRDHRIGWRYRDACAVFAETDIDGPEPIEKQKHVCAAAQLYVVMGMGPWSL